MEDDNPAASGRLAIVTNQAPSVIRIPWKPHATVSASTWQERSTATLLKTIAR